MVSKQAVTIAVVAIVMLVVGIGIGYGVAGTRVVTVTSPVTLTFYTPLTTTTTVRETETMTMYTFSTVTRTVTATATQLQLVTVTTTMTSPTTLTLYTPLTITTTASTTVTQLQPVTITVTVTPTPTQRVVEAVIRQVVQAGPWRLAVLDVKEATYIKKLALGTWSYYQAPEGMKIVIVTLRIENTANETRTLLELSTPTLVTDVNKSYSMAYTYQLKDVYSITSDIEAKTVAYNELDPFTKVAPGSYVEGDIMFLIPQTEKPAKLVIEYWPSPFEPKMVIIIKLS